MYLKAMLIILYFRRGRRGVDMGGGGGGRKGGNIWGALTVDEGETYG